MKKNLGFTLIELMIAMVIGLILMLGIATIFSNTTNNIRLQRGIANIQDAGRISYDFLKNDIADAGALYGSSINIQIAQDGQMPQRPVTSFFVTPGLTYQGNDENARTNTLAASSINNSGLFYGLPTASDTVTLAAAAPVARGPVELLPNAYRISARYFIQGHECTTVSSCVPALTSDGAARNYAGATAATLVAGAAVGQRVLGADVLTIRHLVGNGASIASLTPGTTPVYTLQPGALARLGLTAYPSRLTDRLVMMADTDHAAIYRGDFNAAGTTFTITGALTTDTGALGFIADRNSRIFDMENQFLTVTYFLQNVADPNVPGRIIAALMRQENGRNVEEIARGVERLDFRYKVGEFTRRSGWLTADEVSNLPVSACPPQALDTAEGACGWRDVSVVEVGFLVNTVDDVQIPDTTVTYTMNQVNGAAATGSTLRREFKFSVPIRAWQQ